MKQVSASEVGNWLRLAIQSDAKADLRGSIFKEISDNNWQLRELGREVDSLEDFFVQITYKQNLKSGKRSQA